MGWTSCHEGRIVGRGGKRGRVVSSGDFMLEPKQLVGTHDGGEHCRLLLNSGQELLGVGRDDGREEDKEKILTKNSFSLVIYGQVYHEFYFTAFRFIRIIFFFLNFILDGFWLVNGVLNVFHKMLVFFAKQIP